MRSKLFVSPSLLSENLAGVDIGKQGGIVYNVLDTLLVSEYDGPGTLVEAFTYAERALAENVHPIAGQGLVSTGTLMLLKGIAIGVAASHDVALDFIEPIEWIRKYTMKRTKHFTNKRQWKEYLKNLAREVFPEQYHNQINTKTADAFLMWNYLASMRIGKDLPDYGSLNFNPIQSV